MRKAAAAKGVQLHILKASSESEIEAAFATLVQLHVAGLLVGPDALFFTRREQIFALASRHAVPVMYDSRDYIADGGLISLRLGRELPSKPLLKLRSSQGSYSSSGG